MVFTYEIETQEDSNYTDQVLHQFDFHSLLTKECWFTSVIYTVLED